jgi:thioredoxin 1
MKLISLHLAVTGVAMALATLPCLAQDVAPKTGEAVEHLYPSLASGVLTYAKVKALPEGLLLKADGVEIRREEIEKAIASQPARLKAMLEKNAFYVLEQEAVGKLLINHARKVIAADGQSTDAMSDEQIVSSFVQKLTQDITATEKEQLAFYTSNPQFFTGASFERAKPQIAQYLAQEKKQDYMDDYIRALGQKVPIEVSESWTKSQAVLARDNPLDKARESGKPTLAVFSAVSACCPDTMGPILATVSRQFGSRLNTVSVSLNTDQILAARYRVRGNPFLIFCYADGKEAYRHQGAMSQNEVIAQLSEMGLK